MSISAAVMAHPARAAWARDLARRLDAPIVWDAGRGAWDTGRRALLAYDPDVTHHLVVQDDAVLCRDLLDGLRVAVGYAGQRPIGLYVGRRSNPRSRQAKVTRAVRQADAVGASWISALRWPLWGVASAHPTGMIDHLVAKGDANTDVQPDSYDRRTRRYYRRLGLPAWYMWPSLVDHRRGRSLLGHPNGQAAWRFIGAEASALDPDWSRPPYVLP